MAIKIVTDSTADLPRDLCENLGISTVPLNVQFGETSYLDGIDIQAEEFFSMLATSDKLPTTSQPSPGTFLDHYSNVIGDGHDIVSIHVPLNAETRGMVNKSFIKISYKSKLFS